MLKDKLQQLTVDVEEVDGLDLVHDLRAGHALDALEHFRNVRVVSEERPGIKIKENARNKASSLFSPESPDLLKSFGSNLLWLI